VVLGEVEGREWKAQCHTHSLPYVPEAIWPLKPSLTFEASTDPVDTSAQAALAPHQTKEHKESGYNLATTFMAMRHVLLFTLSWSIRELESIVIMPGLYICRLKDSYIHR
jgi:hypothetical protein